MIYYQNLLFAARLNLSTLYFASNAVAGCYCGALFESIGPVEALGYDDAKAD